MKKILIVSLLLSCFIDIHAAESNDANVQVDKEKVVSMFDNGYCPIDDAYVKEIMNVKEGRILLMRCRSSEIYNSFDRSKILFSNYEYVATSNVYGNNDTINFVYRTPMKETLPGHIISHFEQVIYGIAALERSLLYSYSTIKDSGCEDVDIDKMYKKIEQTRRADIFLIRQGLSRQDIGLNETTINYMLQPLTPTHKTWKKIAHKDIVHSNSAYTELFLTVKE